ncbi:FecR family protein [Pseudodesulfovibrio sediminis]|uniref:FecR protein domain-containing protein n=1 Tax=Pseudodesulfovibrio sediminis TaxID=2810563 RepID=A0ABM8HX91_9BACT|nr:FecR domain-containing protein [Pseudodesulfovibrio sediminis]BCS89312.1 hypothetical protein PSDVSF_25540 [Pseudodesulfovibrio sediminis]
MLLKVRLCNRCLSLLFFPILIIALTLTLALGSPATASEQSTRANAEVVGTVKTTSGTPVIKRNGGDIQAAKGSRLYNGDILTTDDKSSLGLIFRDDSMLSLGPRSEVTVDDFLFEPAEGNMNFLVKIGKGSAELFSGQIAKISPDNMRIETPVSTIGIRGTHILIKVD